MTRTYVHTHIGCACTHACTRERTHTHSLTRSSSLLALIWSAVAGWLWPGGGLVCLSICLSVYLSIYLSVYLSVVASDRVGSGVRVQITIVGWGGQVHRILKAAAIAENEFGVSVEIVDLQTLLPWDRDAVLQSVDKTKRLLISHEAPVS
eukprot:GHVU01177987.1.p1 GENE.GHVU01177987.1~~GHVU01177987.1.p1  ORF type:complete len:150 (+),score=10.75 GHVU01177987.1:208-657(+)